MPIVTAGDELISLFAAFPQPQEPTRLPLGNVLLCGYSGAGKTELLKTLALGLAMTYSPREAQFIITGAPEFDPLPYVGKVGSFAEVEDTLRKMIEDRRATLHGQSYSDPDYEPLAFVLLDEEVSRLMSDPESARTIHELLSEGPSLGIYTVLTVGADYFTVVRQLRDVVEGVDYMLELEPYTLVFRKGGEGLDDEYPVLRNADVRDEIITAISQY